MCQKNDNVPTGTLLVPPYLSPDLIKSWVEVLGFECVAALIEDFFDTVDVKPAGEVTVELAEGEYCEECGKPLAECECICEECGMSLNECECICEGCGKPKGECDCAEGNCECGGNCGGECTCGNPNDEDGTIKCDEETCYDHATYNQSIGVVEASVKTLLFAYANMLNAYDELDYFESAADESDEEVGDTTDSTEPDSNEANAE
ncbi:MAG: hypothetical protein Q4B65_00690 [Candidatus Saccharibacteria bacterium]|nr:hypothetical protein [Candidatus Saccharibacteria bacterium]